MVSAGERTPDYGHTPAILVNAQAELGLPMKALDDHRWNTVLIIVLN